MKTAVGAALLVAGVILVILGINASESFASDVSKFFTGNPTDRAVWLLIGGAVSLVAGLVVIARGRGSLRASE